MWCDHLDVVPLGQITTQAVAVISSVADQSRPESVEETVREDHSQRRRDHQHSGDAADEGLCRVPCNQETIH